MHDVSHIMCRNTCLHTYIHIYIHTYIHTYIHVYMFAWLIKFEKLAIDCSIWVVTVILEYLVYDNTSLFYGENLPQIWGF